MANDGTTERRVAIFGWGLVAPRSPNVDAFAENLQSAESWLEPFDGFGPDNFLVGRPSFDFTAYEPWVVERFKPNRFSQLQSKMGLPVQYAIGSFIQALGQNPGLETELKRLGTGAHVYVGTGLGDFDTQYQQSTLPLPCHAPLDAILGQSRTEFGPRRVGGRRAAPQAVAAVRRAGNRSDRHPALALRCFLRGARRDGRRLVEFLGPPFARVAAIPGGTEGDRERQSRGRRRVGQDRRTQRKNGARCVGCRKKWGAPEPPWQSVSANLLWNIDNIPAAQISMLGEITGPTLAIGAACSTFGVCLKQGLDAIRRGECTAAVIGATDPPPHPLTVGGFYSARVISADGQLSKPLTELRGTHVAGGAVVWILGDLEHFAALGMQPLGMEPLGVGVTSDADHIITPSKEGPMESMRQAFEQSGRCASDMRSWDLHATATPGDFKRGGNGARSDA